MLIKLLLSVLSVLLFAVLVFPCMGLAFAVGPMRCAFPNSCTMIQALTYAVMSLVVLLIPFVILVFCFIGISRL